MKSKKGFLCPDCIAELDAFPVSNIVSENKTNCEVCAEKTSNCMECDIFTCYE